MQIALTQQKPLSRVHAVRRARPARALTAMSVISVLLLAGCGGGSSPSTSSEGGAGGLAPGRDSAQLSSAGLDKSVDRSPAGPADAAKPGAPVVGAVPRLTRSASLDLRVKDISTTAAKVRTIGTGLQALVLSEQIGRTGPGEPQPLSDEPSGGSATLTLSVPADKLDSALDQLGSLGTVLRRSTSSQDVTSQYVDTESRLKTMRASVVRVRNLMAQAKDLGQVVALESEMSRREATWSHWGHS